MGYVPKFHTNASEQSYKATLVLPTEQELEDSKEL